MTQIVSDEVIDSPGTLTPTNSHAESPPFSLEQPPNLKGCTRRLIQGLQRISSSPSLAKMGRISSSGYKSGGRGSMSCVSFSVPSTARGRSYGNSYSRQSTPGLSTAETFDPITPATVSPFPDSKRVRIASEVAGDSFSSKPLARVKQSQKRENFDFWGELPHEIQIRIFQFLKPKEIVRCATVSKAWHKICFDGQLWINVNTEEYYGVIPSVSLVKLITAAGPFIRDLNLRGCEQMRERWGSDGEKISDACRNLQSFSLEGCRIDQISVQWFLTRNPRLVHVNLSGLSIVHNPAMGTIAQFCPQLEHLNVSWCKGIDTTGLQRIILACPKLKDLRTGEIRGFNNKEFLQDLFLRNTLERLVVSHCDDLDDESLQILIHGQEPDIEPVTNLAIVPPRKFRHLDFTQCTALTDKGIQALAHHVPHLSGLQLSKCEGLTDDALTGLLGSTRFLTHLDLEELEGLSNTTLINLSKSFCARNLEHLNISYCESLGDSGLLPLLKSCSRLRSLVCDNTRISDLTLMEAAIQLRKRDRKTPSPLPVIGFHLIVFDCQNVTWAGVREVLSQNSEPGRSEIIELKCFYGYQDTVKEHTKRVLRGDAAAAQRLEKKWMEYMRMTEEAGAGGGGARRRRRRLREAAMVHADEEVGGPRTGRRRARSGGCVVM